MDDRVPSKPPLLIVKYRRTTLVGILFSACALIVGAATTPSMVLRVVFGVIAALILLVFVPTIFRRRPVIVATADGVELSMFGSEVSCIPWSQAVGFEVVGPSKNRELAFVVDNVESPFLQVKKALKDSAKSRNQRYGLTAAAYLPEQMLSIDIQEVADRLRAIAIERLESGDCPRR
jgi:hypothetical protein